MTVLPSLLSVNPFEKASRCVSLCRLHMHAHAQDSVKVINKRNFCLVFVVVWLEICPLSPLLSLLRTRTCMSAPCPQIAFLWFGVSARKLAIIPEVRDSASKNRHVEEAFGAKSTFPPTFWLPTGVH